MLFRKKFRRYFSENQARQFLVDARDRSLFGADVGEAPPYTPDPKDDYLVALALAAGADYLVSGDPHLSGLEDEAIPTVVSPREFLTILEECRAKTS